MDSFSYQAADFPLDPWIGVPVAVFFWAFSSFGLIMGVKSGETKAVQSIGIAMVGIAGVTLPLWLSHAVAFVANGYQGMA